MTIPGCAGADQKSNEGCRYACTSAKMVGSNKTLSRVQFGPYIVSPLWAVRTAPDRALFSSFSDVQSLHVIYFIEMIYT